MKRVLFLVMLALTIPSEAFARAQAVRAVEGDISTPYKTIGTLEVKCNTGGLAGIGKKSLQVLSLGAYDASSGESYRERLKTKLVKKASKHYGANAVINVHYWPNPDSGSFPNNTIYARGEMVRYTKFPSES